VCLAEGTVLNESPKKKYQRKLEGYVENKIQYSLRPIILFANIDVSRHSLVVDTSILVKSNMSRRE
jgi:hypothetical protein